MYTITCLELGWRVSNGRRDWVFDTEAEAEAFRARRVKMDARNATRRERDGVLRSLGLVKVRGGLGGTYWE